MTAPDLSDAAVERLAAQINHDGSFGDDIDGRKRQYAAAATLRALVAERATLRAERDAAVAEAHDLTIASIKLVNLGLAHMQERDAATALNRELGDELDRVRAREHALKRALEDISAGRGRCAGCGRPCDMPANCTPLDCEDRRCAWEPIDPIAAARAALAATAGAAPKEHPDAE